MSLMGIVTDGIEVKKTIKLANGQELSVPVHPRVVSPPPQLAGNY
jgi:hypothetical protein